MNSYPPELLAQLAPVMFVAGLDATPPTAAVPTSPTSSTTVSKPHDAFQVLSLRLRETLLAQRKVAIWQPEKNKSFQVILVDRDVKFPPRKLVPHDDPQYSTAHSPLSPLTPTSPLHPDGLIAPIWIRKHTSLVPSVFVLFLRIFESPPHASRTPLDLPDADKEREREAEERKKDAELATDISSRKKITNERGIKLTVVLMASRKMLGAFKMTDQSYLASELFCIQMILRWIIDCHSSEDKVDLTLEQPSSFLAPSVHQNLTNSYEGKAQLTY